MLEYNKIFSLIIKKILRTENNIFLSNYDKTDSINLIYKTAFLPYDNVHLKDGQYIPYNSNKFLFLDNILKSFMIKGEKENETLDYFCKIQKVYHALNKFALIIKYRKAKIVVNRDMELNEININDKNVICLYQEKAKYLFKIYDLIKIINISLCNSCNFFSDPLCIKNPYNNIPFNKSTLYYIYFYLIRIPNILLKFNILELFLKFYEFNFNLTNFLSKYEYLLREHNIKNHIRNSINDDLYDEIKIMLSTFNKNKLDKNRIIISPRFPKEIVVKVFKPYLLLYTNSKHLLIPILKREALFKLYDKLLNFQNFNPFFGRIKITFVQKLINNKFKKVKIEEYNNKHIKFENNNNNFLCDHLSYKYKHYIINTNSFYEDSTEDDDGDYQDHGNHHFHHNDQDDGDTQDNSDDNSNNISENNDDTSEGFDIDSE
jgi:hypothetical protein